LRDEPFAGDDFREAFRNLLSIDNIPINNLQEKLITLIKLKLNQHISTSRQQLIDYILKVERNNRFFFKLERWFIMLNLLPENFENAREGEISFDEFVRYADSFVRSLEQRDILSQEAVDDEPLHDKLQ
jgi:rRNA pseudouridine-1189 N-methylase Emg1 (Nep1/Mra1 family)